MVQKCFALEKKLSVKGRDLHLGLCLFKAEHSLVAVEVSSSVRAVEYVPLYRGRYQNSSTAAVA